MTDKKELNIQSCGGLYDAGRGPFDRYLGWPAQAISYKLGERVWLQLRDEARARHGAAFDIRAQFRQQFAHLRVGVLGGSLCGHEPPRATLCYAL